MLQQSVLSARMAMAITDPRQDDNPIVFVNPAFTEMTGYSASEVLGRNCRFLQGAATDPIARDHLKEALRTRRDIEVDLLNYRRDGAPFHNRLFISPVFDERRELIHFFASQLDITAQKRAEAISRRREFLLRQISNTLSERMRTTFAAVQVIVNDALTAASSIVSATEEISAKLMSLGHVNQSLLKEDWNDLDLQDLVESIVSSFPNVKERIQVSGPSVVLDPVLSFKAAAIIHDLCVGSIRHGALSAQDGRITVNWSLRDEGGLPCPIVAWREVSQDLLRTSAELYRPLIAAKQRGDVRSVERREGGSGEICYLIDLRGNELAGS